MLGKWKGREKQSLEWRRAVCASQWCLQHRKKEEIMVGKNGEVCFEKRNSSSVFLFNVPFSTG